jgi:phosphatidylglycerophosphate synthase
VPDRAGLAFKAYEIEEFVNVRFYRPLGILVARAARALGMTPNGVTMAAAAVGVAGGALLVSERLALGGFALLVMHSVLDSADGQLARLTGQVSEHGRMLDGLAGYLTHVSIYVAILLGAGIHRSFSVLISLAVLAAVANIVHAQLYDYHRSVYKRVVIDGAVGEVTKPHAGADLTTRVISIYESMERRLAGVHADVEATVAARSLEGVVRPDDRARYRACFYSVVHGWNVLGDLTRFYAVGVLAWLHHLEWFFAFILIPMNLALVVLWLWQWRADRRFLAGL